MRMVSLLLILAACLACGTSPRTQRIIDDLDAVADKSRIERQRRDAEFIANQRRRQEEALADPRQIRIDHYLAQSFDVCTYNMESTIKRIDPYYDSFYSCWYGHDWYVGMVNRLIRFEDDDLDSGCNRIADDGATHLCEILSTEDHLRIVGECKGLAAIGNLTDATRAVLCIEDAHRLLLESVYGSP